MQSGALVFTNDSSCTVTDESHGKRLLKFLYDCYQKEFHCDVVIQVDAKSFKTHKFVLAMFSDYLRAVLQRHHAQNIEQPICLTSMITADNFSAALDYAYTGKITLDKLDVEALAVSSDFLGISSVKHICEEYMTRQLCIQNCTSMLFFGDTYSMGNLHDRAKTFWCRDFRGVTGCKTFYKLPVAVFLNFLKDDKIILYKNKSCNVPLNNLEREQALFKAVIQYAVYQADVSETLELFKSIKMNVIPEAYLLKHLNKYKALYKNSELMQLVQLARQYKESKISSELVPVCWLTSRRPPIYKNLTSASFGSYENQYERVRSVRKFGLHTSRDIGDENCKIEPYAVLSKISLRFRRWDGRIVLERLHVFYKGGSHYESSDTVCSTTDDQEDLVRQSSRETVDARNYDIELENDETIKSVDVVSGWLIDSIRFITNTGRAFGPYGGDGGSPNTQDIPPNYHLHAISGEVTNSQGSEVIKNLRFHWITYE